MIPPEYLWKTDLSASTVTEVGPLAIAAIRDEELPALTLLMFLTLTCPALAWQDPVLAVYGY